MTKRYFKALPRLLDFKKVQYIKLYSQEYYSYPKDIKFGDDTITFTLTSHRIWSKGNPYKFKEYQNYKVLVKRKDIQDINLYIPQFIVR